MPQGHHKQHYLIQPGARYYRIYTGHNCTGFAGFMRTWPDGQAPEYWDPTHGKWQHGVILYNSREMIRSPPPGIITAPRPRFPDT